MSEAPDGCLQGEDARRAHRCRAAPPCQVRLRQREEHRLPDRGAATNNLDCLRLYAGVNGDEDEGEVGAIRGDGAHAIKHLMPWRVHEGERAHRRNADGARRLCSGGIRGGGRAWQQRLEGQQRRAHALSDVAWLARC